MSAISAERLASSHTPDLIGAWCAYAAKHRTMGPGALVNCIRHGAPPPSSAGPRRLRFEP